MLSQINAPVRGKSLHLFGKSCKIAVCDITEKFRSNWLQLLESKMYKTVHTLPKIRQIDIAQKARVAPSTVSKILTGMPCAGISKKTRSRVFEVCRRYDINVHAKLKNHNVVLGVYEVEYVSQFFFSKIFTSYA